MINGAVSPPILATDKSTPVTNPLLAAERIILVITTHCRSPKAMPASLYVKGTILSDSSVVLATIGNIMRERANAPAHTEKCPRTKTITKNAKIPSTIEGKFHKDIIKESNRFCKFVISKLRQKNS